MAERKTTTLDTRRAQMYPVLTPPEVDRLRRFGQVQGFVTGDVVVREGQTGLGMALILKGRLAVSRRDHEGHKLTLVEEGPGEFLAELAQLSGRPALVDAHALEDLEVLRIPPDQLRALLVAEAELGERIMRALILRRVNLLERGVGGPVIVGYAGQADVLRLEGFLDRNGHPHQLLDPEDDEGGRALVERFHIAEEELPIVLCPNGDVVRNPTITQLGRCLGLIRPLDPDKTYDVAVVGAGPAGLATAVYAASEGLSVVVFDALAFGGQAGASARIENYLGFPTGISGMALMGRAFSQAQKFGAEIAIPLQAKSLDCQAKGNPLHFTLTTPEGETTGARTVVIASGARYRRLDVAGLDGFEGSSVHYWASPVEARLCAGQEVALVGAGNSAGQAAVYLASQVGKVWMIVRGPSLDATMSRYLIDRIKAQPNIEVLTQTEVTALQGEDGCLSGVTLKNRRTGKETPQALQHLFLFIGADPNTDWLTGCSVDLDAKGFVCTGQDGRPLLETSRPGVFAIGDVRAGSVKRVAAAVGEGAQAVAAIHAYLAAEGEAAQTPVQARSA